MARIKYSVVSGTPRFTQFPVPLAASQNFLPLSGRYVTRDSSTGTYALSSSTSQQIDGYVDDIFTSVAGQQIPIIENVDEVVVEIPAANAGTAVTVTDTIIRGLMSEACDTVLSNGVQYCNYNVGSNQTRVLVVVGGNVADNVVYTKVNSNPSNLRPVGAVS